MYYIKPVENNGIFVHNFDYIKVSPSSGSYIATTKDDYQGIVINGTPYSINKESPLPYAQEAELIEYKDWTEDIKQAYKNIRCEEAKFSKIPFLSKSCNETINKGMEIELSTGLEKFSYNLEDQSNISEMFNAVMMGAKQYPYHANEGNCRLYNAQDIIKIYTTLSGFKTSQITYHNQLKQYVKNLTTAEEVYRVEYGQELTGEYLEHYNAIVDEAVRQTQDILMKMVNLE